MKNRPLATVENEEAIVETYTDVEPLLFKLCHQFHGRYNIPFDELCSEGRYLFMMAFRGFDPERGAKFSTWFYFVLHRQLTTYCHRQYRHLTKEVAWDEQGDNAEVSVPVNQLMGLIEFVGQDAAEVVKLIQQSPVEIITRLLWEGRTSHHGFRLTLISYLIDMGWSRARVDNTFAEIKAAMA
tara:strand:- start:189 stop:737 length:549 start_codon:yes stop_codon:yes gene_type:complete